MRITNTLNVRQALLDYHDVARMRVEVIANNVRNADTTRRGDGREGPYLRQYIVLDSSGRIQDVKEDTHLPDRFLRYEPEHPDGNADGYVKYPNVDLIVEMQNMIEASRQLEESAELLRRFDPELVIPRTGTSEYSFAGPQ